MPPCLYLYYFSNDYPNPQKPSIPLHKLKTPFHKLPFYPCLNRLLLLPSIKIYFMSKNTESGHQKNVDNFNTLNIGVASYGIKYKPSNPKIALLALQTAYSVASKAKVDSDDMLKIQKDAILERNNCFNPIPKLSTRILRALITSDVDAGVITQAKAFVAKIRGERMIPLPKVVEPVLTTPTPVPPIIPVTHSVSQQSFTNMVDHFNGLMMVANNEENYKPNETDLTIISLTALVLTMKKDNRDCDTAMFNYNNAIIARNVALYEPKSGICDLAATTKTYISQLYGLKSPEYKSILKIKFVKLVKLAS